MRQAKAAAVGYLLLSFAVLLAAGLLVGAITGSPALGELLGFAAIVAMLLRFARDDGGPRGLGLVPVPWRQLAGAVLFGSSWFLVLGVINDLLMPTFDSAYIHDAMTRPSLVLVFASFAIGAPIAEELLFRGVVLPGFLGLGRRWAVVISALLFSAWHVMPAQLFPAFLTGLALGAIAVRTRSIVPGIVVHVTNNAVVVGISMSPLAAMLDRHLSLAVACALLPLAAGSYLLFSASSSARATPASPSR